MIISQKIAQGRALLTEAQALRTVTDADNTHINGTTTNRISAAVSSGRRVDANAIRDQVRSEFGAERMTRVRTLTHAAHSFIGGLRAEFNEERRSKRGPVPVPNVLTALEEKTMLSIERGAIESLRRIERELRGLRFRQDYAQSAIDEIFVALERAEGAKDHELTNFLEPLVERKLQEKVPMMGVDPVSDITAHKERVARLERLRDGRLSDDDRKALSEAEASLAALERDAKHDDQVWRAYEHVGSIMPNEVVVG
ncbi:MAG TPA: hypothetical protein VLV86_09760 [Vicinamibacterales bacterium]|nr:hypothetical protein [Vicinamibacterales bacterium]